ncbi:hypothetical protein E8E13_004667 [Curvularia kusanoi]|uniref:Uncharacterized protein n=1 Tax=Curvularia kusanoi TaxID=90978 RepID=A0A9P4T6W5_CURKU|nr:hypothetical protein E8E13_004667 [Curvularia kusanoi]
MARGVDQLIDHLLSEIALTGIQGAGSADFKRFVQSYYDKSQAEDGPNRSGKPSQVGSAFYGKVWQWVIGHADIRIAHNGDTCHYTLAEFEAAETPNSNPPHVTNANEPTEPLAAAAKTTKLSSSLSALKDSVRQRLVKEGLSLQATSLQGSFASSDQSGDSSLQHIKRAPRVIPTRASNGDIVFDDVPTNITTPRLFASQSRIWQALTGHGIDLKKVPMMEFILLSLIASHGETGITQPDLTTMSGQDKRSVPKRTDELCRKGYIEKRPVQSGKLRTSLCVHKKFVTDDHFLTSGKVEDVFQPKKFVVSGFVHLLYNTLKDAGVVPTRDMRTRLNVPMTTWNKRAVQGALIRLDQSGMIKRFRARRKDSEDNWLTCIEVLREPRPEDHDNLKFRRHAAQDEVEDDQSDEEIDGDTMMKNLEVDMLNSSAEETAHGQDDGGRIPPQWVPERLLANTLYEVIAMGGPDGRDAGMLRDRIVGKFWRRPMESYLTRLTDDWEATQPAYIRHLALIRDTRNTQEKKFVHYVYRTYGNFSKAVEAGEVIWAGVSKPPPSQPSANKGGRPKKTNSEKNLVDQWGFRAVESKNFLNKDGSGTLSDCRTAIIHARTYGPRWDNSFVDDIGYEKIDTPKPDKPRPKAKTQSKLSFGSFGHPKSKASPETPIRQSLIADAATDSEDATSTRAAMVMGLPKRKYESGLLTIDQRIALGLKPKGRLSKFVEDQIRDHRKQSGDQLSIPDSIILERPAGTPKPPKLGPLMSKEERIAAGLPPRGRLGQKMENQIREQKGLPKSVEKAKKPRKSRPANEPALLSKQQRIQLGITHNGRLPQSLIEGLREEREFEIAFDQSRVIPVYLDAVKNGKAKPEITRVIDEVRIQTVQEFDPGRKINDSEDDDPEETTPVPETPSVEKRKANDDPVALLPTKKLRIGHDTTTVDVGAVIPTPPPTATTNVYEPEVSRPEQSPPAGVHVDNEAHPATTSIPANPSEVLSSSDAPLGFDLSEVGAKVQLIKAKYSNRAAPGLYIDPFAKRRIGQGRPRNAYIATFRLPKLSSLDWFKPNVPTSSVDIQPAHPQTMSPAARNPEGVATEHLTDLDEFHTTSDLPASADQASSASEVVHPLTSEQNQIQGLEGAANEPVFNKPEADAANVTCDTENAGASTSDQSNLERASIPYEARSVAGWNAINKPLQPLTEYQSPYTTTGTPESTQNFETPENEVMDTRTEDNKDESQIQGVCGPITETDIASRRARKYASYVGTKTGGGSQKMFRQKVILQIIELCNGAYPLHGEIGRPFATLWKQQYPNIPQPNSSTVLSNLREMIADSQYGLKKFSFLMRLRQSAGLKRKDMVVYQHLTPTSPQVTKLAFKMANYSSTKAHQYYPEEVLHLVTDESFYVPMPVAPKDDSISLEALNPSLQHKIKEANLERRRRYYHQQKNEESARDAQNAGVEAPLKRTSNVNGQPRTKRARLASLNDKNKRYRRAPLSTPSTGPMDPELEESVIERSYNTDNRGGRDLDSTLRESRVEPKECLVSTIMSPISRFYASNGTFSTEFGIIRNHEQQRTVSLSGVYPHDVPTTKSTKRVRIVQPQSPRPVKKVRLSTGMSEPLLTKDLVVESSEDSEDSYSSSTSDSSSDAENSVPLMQLSAARAKARAKAEAKAKAKAKRDTIARQRGSPKGPLPTLLEHLTGLTGDANAVAKAPRKSAPHRQRKYPAWGERKKAQLKKLQQQRKFPVSHDPVDQFKRVCCTLIIASSMAGGAGRVDWSMVEKMQKSKRLDLAKTKALWIWMQSNMSSEIADLTAQFEGEFLNAYEKGEVGAIEDPSTYDWAYLVRWAMHSCVYPELSLPVWREALQHFIVDLSSFEALDRPRWYREAIADRVRTQVQLQYSFNLPLYWARANTPPIDGTELKARSWIRANTATPQAAYESKPAHDKLRKIGDPVLAKVVGEYVDRQMLRMRKFKRVLPGRNYTFTAKLAKMYGRTFQLSDFMAAVKVKKDMDATFANEDPEKRFYSLSRAEKDGAIMAVMSLLGDGRVMYAPQLPAVNNEFGAPLPRLSVWGFMEGDYIHRGIDRQRLFWDIHVIPTDRYEYGNPLRPCSAPPGIETEHFTKWSALPPPPLPGKDDPDALLPIWSSMDGQAVTWPWWYRILNIVLQPLIYQPGATVQDILANCDEYTTEAFEVELVLQWLLAINAVKQITGGGFVTLPGIWAVFGDVLHDLDDDWLNTHVKRKNDKHKKQYWRDQYHLKFSVMQSRDTQRRLVEVSDESDAQSDDERIKAVDASTDIMRRPKEQYAIVREKIAEAPYGISHAEQPEGPFNQPDSASACHSATPTPDPRITGNVDVEMQNAEAD